MARGGFSTDPATAAKQKAALAAGRLEAAERRKAGLPTKRREAELSGNAPAKIGSRVKRGTHAGSSASSPAKSPARSRQTSGSASPAAPGKQAGARRSPAKPPAKTEAGGGGLNLFERAYARIAGLG